MHPARLAVLTALREMGGSIELIDRRLSGGEDVADLRVTHSPLLGIEVDPRGLTPAAIPPLAVAGAFAAGQLRLPRLGFSGEPALHKTLAEMLSANGATAGADARGLSIGRPARGGRLGGERINAGGDPFLAAAFVVFGLGAAEQVTLEDDGPLQAAFPDLIGGLEALGAEFFRLEAL